jgi:hypothetical protein
MEERRTNLRMEGRLLKDPVLGIRRNANELYCSWSLTYPPGNNSRGQQPKIDFLTYDQKLAEYIASKFQKDDWMQVTDSKPTAVPVRATKAGVSVRTYFYVFDIKPFNEEVNRRYPDRKRSAKKMLEEEEPDAADIPGKNSD